VHGGAAEHGAARLVAEDDKTAVEHRGGTGGLEAFPEREELVGGELDAVLGGSLREAGAGVGELLAPELHGVAQGGGEAVGGVVDPLEAAFDLGGGREQPQARARVIEGSGGAFVRGRDVAEQAFGGEAAAFGRRRGSGC
jgi:hypothetical protein